MGNLNTQYHAKFQFVFKNIYSSALKDEEMGSLPYRPKHTAILSEWITNLPPQPSAWEWIGLLNEPQKENPFLLSAYALVLDSVVVVVVVFVVIVISAHSVWEVQSYIEDAYLVILQNSVFFFILSLQRRRFGRRLDVPKMWYPKFSLGYLAYWALPHICASLYNGLTKATWIFCLLCIHRNDIGIVRRSECHQWEWYGHTSS